MADNVAISAGSGTTVGTDEVSLVHYQRVKVVWGPDGTVNDADTAAAKALPVQLVPQTANGLTIFRSLDLDES